MIDLSHAEDQVLQVSSLKDLLSTPFEGDKNAMFLNRELQVDFSEIINKVELPDNLIELTPEALKGLQLSEQGELARNIILQDLEALKAHGASPVLNVIKSYARDEDFPFFPTDVYSYHVDRSPIPTSTFLCTYSGASSEIIPNSKAEHKILIPEIRNELKKLHDGPESEFDAFLSEYFFDLHYQPKPEAVPVNLGIGNLWKLAVDHPQSKVDPCIHRAPIEKKGECRLMLIC